MKTAAKTVAQRETHSIKVDNDTLKLYIVQAFNSRRINKDEQDYWN